MSNKKKIYLVSVVTLAVVVIGIILIMTTRSNSVSRLLADGTTLFKTEQYDAAKPLLEKAIIEDPGNEEAFYMLAVIAEKEHNFYAASQYYAMVMDLNPLSKEREVDFYRTSLQAGIGLVAYNKYRVAQLSGLDDAMLYQFMLIGTHVGQTEEEIVAKIHDQMRERRSPYAELFDAGLANMKAEKGAFQKYVVLEQKWADSKEPLEEKARENLYVILGAERLERLNFERRNGIGGYTNLITDCRKYLDAIEGKDLFAVADSYLIKGRMALAEGNLKKAREAWDYVLEMQRANLQLRLDCAELAYVDRDMDYLKTTLQEINGQTREGVSVAHYLQSLMFLLKAQDIEDKIAEKEALNGKAAEATAEQSTPEAIELKELQKSALNALTLAGTVADSRVAARVLRFKLAFDLGDIEQTVAAGDQLVKMPLPIQLETLVESLLLKMVATCEARYDREHASSFANFLLMLNPKQPVGLSYTMMNDVTGGNYMAAIRSAEDLLAIEPDNKIAFETRCVALYGLKRYQEGVSFTQARLKENPEDPIAMTFLARFLMRLGEVDKALDGYAKIGKYVPADVCEEAGIALMEGEHDMESFLKSLEESDDVQKQMVAKGLRAKSFENSGDFEKAEALMREAVELCQDAPGVRINLAKMLYDEEKIDEAKKVLEEGLEVMPESVELKVRLAALLLEYDDEESAKKCVELLSPASVEKNGVAYSVLSAAYAKLGMRSNALDAAKTAMISGDGGSEAALQLGYRYVEDENYPEAAKVLQSAIDLNPNDLRIREAYENAMLYVVKHESNRLVQKMQLQGLLERLPESENGKKLLAEILTEEQKEAAAAKKTATGK